MPLADGGKLCLELPEPGLIADLDPNEVGLAVLSSTGQVLRTWGIATRIPYFESGENLYGCEIGPLVLAGTSGATGSIYLNGYRYHVASTKPDGDSDVVVLVTNAQDEFQIKQRANRSARTALALKQIGKALTMNQTMQPLCVAAVHEVASTCDLAAVLLWVSSSDEKRLELMGSVGVNRHGATVLKVLDTSSGMSCVAELVANSRHSFCARSVYDNLLTSELESKFCYLKPGPILVLPLVIGDRLLGVLELIGKERDTAMNNDHELYFTIAEHLALALNSAILFENVERLATVDPLTGIANHRSMQEFLHKRVNEAQRIQQELAVIMLDVDHFRQFNEEEGHDAGDEVLKSVVEVLKASVRPYDMAARYGGEEFTIVMPGIGRDMAMRVAERIREKVEALSYVTRSGRVRHVTASLGVSIFPTSSRDAAGVLKAADLALYKAKRSGRNKVVMYQGKLTYESTSLSVEPSAVLSWVPEESRAEVLENGKRLQPVVVRLSRHLGLSTTQETILRALVLLAPSYLSAKAAGDVERVKAMETAEALRTLAPTLMALEERYDGKGPRKLAGAKIPLLSRVVTVVLALTDSQTPNVQDSGRFDPELLAIAADIDDAA